MIHNGKFSKLSEGFVDVGVPPTGSAGVSPRVQVGLADAREDPTTCSFDLARVASPLPIRMR